MYLMGTIQMHYEHEMNLVNAEKNIHPFAHWKQVKSVYAGGRSQIAKDVDNVIPLLITVSIN